MKRMVSLLSALILLIGCCSFASAEEPITLRMAWWGGDSRHEATIKAIEAYKALHPNVTIEPEYVGNTTSYLSKLYAELGSGTAPDIIQIDYKWLKDFTDQSQNFVNLYDYADVLPIDQLDEGIVNTYCVRNGFFLGIPIGLNALCINTNVDALAAMGIEFPVNPSWEDIIEMGKAVQAKDSSKYLLWIQTGHYYQLFRAMMFQRLGTNPFNEETYAPNFTADDVAAYFTWLKEAVETKTIPPLEETEIYGKVFANEIPGWLEQRYLAATSGASTMATVINASPFNVGVATWPILADAKAFGTMTSVLSMMFGITSTSKHPEIAADFIAWYSNDETAIEIMKDARGIPINKKALSILTEKEMMMPQVAKAIELATMEGALAENPLDLNTTLTATFDYYYQTVGYNQMSPEEAAAAYMSDLEMALADLKAAQ